MVRFALFWLTGGSILTAAGFFPTPSSDQFPDFLKAKSTFDETAASAPIAPTLLADQTKLVLNLPQDETSIEPFVVQPLPQQDETAVDGETDIVELALDRLVMTAGQVVSRVVEQRVSAEATVVEAPAIVASIVNFDHNEAALDPFAQSKLDAMAMWLADNPSETIGIFGHTDLTGTETYNESLGQVRADRVAAYLMSKGISADRIGTVMSYGETAPLVHVEGESRENRRVLIQTIQSL